MKFGTIDALKPAHCSLLCSVFNSSTQAIGRKRWYFLDPKYSAYMHPLRGGKV